MEDKIFLSAEELSVVQQMHTDFNKLKSVLADVTLQQNSIIKMIDEMRNKFMAHEEELIQKYGKDTVLNIQTGEIKQKENG